MESKITDMLEKTVRKQNNWVDLNSMQLSRGTSNTFLFLGMLTNDHVPF